MDNIVLVAGFNYHSLTPGTLIFSPSEIARRRCAEIFAGAPGNQAARLCRGAPRITLLDVEHGTISAFEQNALGDTRERVVASHVPISPENYQWVDPGRWLFCQKGDGVLSILDAYRLLTDLGRREPGTLIELSFIAHAWAGGPALVNSDDRIDRARKGPAPHDEPRDPLDKDGRRFKDFRPPTTSPDDLNLMRLAFADGSYLWNWGCNNSHASADVLAQVVRSEPSLLDARSALDRAIPFCFTPQQAQLYFDVDPSFFPVGELAFQRSIGDVATFLRRRMLSTYNGQAALALGRPCFGSLPGMPSDIERCGAFPQMVVPHTPGYSVNRAEELRFYEQYLGVGFDLEGRRFGVYRPHDLDARADQRTAVNVPGLAGTEREQALMPGGAGVLAG